MEVPVTRYATTRDGVHIAYQVFGDGPVEVELRGTDIGGIAVHTAARVAALAGPDQVVVTRTVVDLVSGAGLEFTALGDHELKGVPGTFELLALTR